MAETAPPRQSELNPVTLGLAALASVVATVAVARFGLAGSLVGAALAPVITTLVQEYGRKPIEGAAVLGQVARQAGRRGAPGAARGGRAGAEPRPGPVTIHRTPRSRLRHVRWGVVALTSVLAFVVAVAAFTVPDLLAGKSIVSGRDTTFFSPRDPAPAADAPAAEEQPSEAEGDTPTEITPAPESDDTETGATEPEPPAEAEPEPAPEATPAPAAPPAEVAPAP